METNKIYQGDCLELMKQIEDKSIDLVVTSPPYDNLRDYKGYSFDFEGIARELFRILKEGGVIVWVVNDATIDNSKTGTSFKQALFFKQLGFNFHDTMIYAKKNAQPNSQSKRYNSRFEYVFIFSKGIPKTFNPLKKFKECEDKRKRKPTQRRKDGKMIVKNVRSNDWVKLGNIWFYATGGGNTTKDDFAFEHPAMFPEKLAEDHILTWSNKEDIVLDPMCGAGTTCKMAKLNLRNFIGIDISEEYCKIARKRIEQNTLFQTTQLNSEGKFFSSQP